MKTHYLNFLTTIRIEGFLLSCLVLCCCLLSGSTQAQQLASDMTEEVQELTLDAVCVDESLINDDVACPEIYQPVCGCDGVTYENKCVAENRYGITDYKEGACDCKAELKIVSRKLTCDGYAVCIAIDGTAPFSISVSDGSTADVNDDGVFCLRGLQGGQYFINVKDSKGCMGSLGLNLPAVDYYIPGEVKNVSCNGGADGAIAIKIDTDQDVKFEWSGPNGYSSNAQNIDGLAAGVYTVKVSYADGSCYGIMAYTVGEPRELKLDVELSYADCEGQPDGCAFVKGGTAPYRLFVFTGDIANDVVPEVVVSADGVDVEGLTPNDEMEFDESLNNDFTKYCAKNIPDGIYLILVLDANGCYVWKRVKVEAGKPLDVEVKVDHLSCHGADDGAICYSISGGTAPYKAVIVPATPIVPVEGEKGCFEGLPAGTYELIITDANGCQFLKVLEIRQADELVANFRFTSDICDEAASGCLTVKGGTKPYRIFVFTRPTVADALPEPVITDDNQATVDGMDRTDVLPYNDVVTDEFERCADNIPAGIYYVLVIDEAGCYTYVKIEIPAGGGLSIDGRVKDVSCFGGSDGEIKIDIQGGQAPYTIVWTAEDGTTFDEAVNLPAGKYKVEVKDANGCTGAARFEIRQPEELSIEFRITSPDCADQVDGCLKVSGGTPGYKIWVFTCPDNAPVPTDVEPVFAEDAAPTIENMVRTDEVIFYPNTDDGFVACAQDIPAAVYYVLVVDHNGCWKLRRIKIEAPNGGLEIVGEVTHVDCHGDATGAIDIKVTNGTAPFKYSWSNGAETEDISGLPAGEYIVKVEDANGCVGRQRFVVRQPDALSIDFRITSADCAGQVDGCLKVSGGTPGYKIWIFTCPEDAPYHSDVEPVFDADEVPAIDGMTRTDEVIFHPNTDDGFVACAQDIPAALYYVLVVDENGCWKVKRIKIEAAGGGLEILSDIKHVRCNGNADGVIDIKVPNATPPVQYSWSNGSTTEDIDGLTAGEYTVKVEDANGCTARMTFIVRQPTALEVDFRITSEACAPTVDGCLKVSGGTPGYKVWAYQCPTPLPVIADPIFTNTDVAPVIDGMQLTDVVAFDTAPQDEYIRCAKDIPAGIYYILVVDSNRCWKLEKVEVPAPSGIRIKSEVKCSNGNDGAIDIEVSGGDSDVYYYTWSNGATTQDISGLAPGEYKVDVYTDNDFCTATATFVVRECCDIVLNCKYDFFGEYACVDPEGGTPDYKIEYQNLSTGEVINNSDDPYCVFDLEPGTYYVIVTDANGCTADEIFIIEERPCKAGEAIVDPKEISSGESTVFTLVNYTGTSLQWQFMTEDTDWIDVPGGTTDVFVTPPIHVGKDKRIKVRAAVTCADGTVLYSTEAVFYVLVANTNRVVDTAPTLRDAELFDAKIPAANALDVQVYPTVTRNDVTLQFETDYQTPTRVEVIDLNGQVKQRIDAGLPTTGETRTINLSGYQPGMYMISVESNGARRTQRIFVGN